MMGGGSRGDEQVMVELERKRSEQHCNLPSRSGECVRVNLSETLELLDATEICCWRRGSKESTFEV